MSSQEKRVTVSLLSSLIVLALYIYYGAGLHGSGALDGPEASYLVGKSAFVMIGVGIAVSIVIHIIFTIVHTVTAGRQDDESGADERDKLIELKAMQIAFVTFSFAFLTLLGVMTFGSIGPYLVILITIASRYGASILADCIKLALYRRGC